MADTYFVYKANRITGIGGIVPKNNEYTDLGLYNKREWYLGKTSDPTFFNYIREFNPIVVDSTTASGFKYLDSAGVIEDDGFGNITTREFTTYEESLKTSAEKFMDKLEVRAKIESEVGDVYDLISDLSKRLALIERALVYTMRNILNGDPIPTKYQNLVNTMATLFVTDPVTDPVDICGIDENSLVPYLGDRVRKISEILNDTGYYS
jgi:hypothetical protein